jgi:orotate phosphoribosyltransferase
MPHSKRIAEFLLDIGAVRLSIDHPFTWTSGIKSPIYCDNRMVLSHPDARSFIVDALTDCVRHLHIEPDAIVGTATAGIPWGTLVADRLGLPFAYVRVKSKSHGTAKRIEGDLSSNTHLVVIEDLLSTGGSAIEAVNILREELQCDVSDVVALFSYDLHIAREKAQECGVRFHPLATLSTLLCVAREQGMVSDEESLEIIRFSDDPQNWRVS